MAGDLWLASDERGESGGLPVRVRSTFGGVMELGLTTFAEITDSGTSPGERLRQVVEEAKLADELGLEVYAIGEHHRPDMAVSAPEIVLATIAGCTKTINLSSAVIVLRLVVASM